MRGVVKEVSQLTAMLRNQVSVEAKFAIECVFRAGS